MKRLRALIHKEGRSFGLLLLFNSPIIILVLAVHQKFDVLVLLEILILLTIERSVNCLVNYLIAYKARTQFIRKMMGLFKDPKSKKK